MQVKLKVNVFCQDLRCSLQHHLLQFPSGLCIKTVFNMDIKKHHSWNFILFGFQLGKAVR